MQQMFLGPRRRASVLNEARGSPILKIARAFPVRIMFTRFMPPMRVTQAGDGDIINCSSKFTS
jgi:hypothetical protein